MISPPPLFCLLFWIVLQKANKQTEEWTVAPLCLNYYSYGKLWRRSKQQKQPIESPLISTNSCCSHMPLPLSSGCNISTSAPHLICALNRGIHPLKTHIIPHTPTNSHQNDTTTQRRRITMEWMEDYLHISSAPSYHPFKFIQLNNIFLTHHEIAYSS